MTPPVENWHIYKLVKQEKSGCAFRVELIVQTLNHKIGSFFKMTARSLFGFYGITSDNEFNHGFMLIPDVARFVSR
jgi:hypothetical protein